MPDTKAVNLVLMESGSKSEDRAPHIAMLRAVCAVSASSSKIFSWRVKMSSKFSKAALMIMVKEKDGEKMGGLDSGKCCEKNFSNDERMVSCGKAKNLFKTVLEAFEKKK